jgi:hypothetical protein
MRLLVLGLMRLGKRRLKGLKGLLSQTGIEFAHSCRVANKTRAGRLPIFGLDLDCVIVGFGAKQLLHKSRAIRFLGVIVRRSPAKPWRWSWLPAPLRHIALFALFRIFACLRIRRPQVHPRLVARSFNLRAAAEPARSIARRIVLTSALHKLRQDSVAGPGNSLEGGCLASRGD